MAEPGYQTLLDPDIPSVELADGAGRVRVIAGDFDGHRGPARTFTPMDVWDVRLNQGHATRFSLPEGRTLALVVLRGTVLVNGSEVAREAQLVLVRSCRYRDRDRGQHATPRCCCSAASRSTSRSSATARS